MNADPEFYAALRRQAGVAFDKAVLHFDRAAHGVEDAAKLDEAAGAGTLDDAPAMGGDGGVDQIAAQPPEARQGAILVRARERAIADDIRDQDRRNLPGLAHGASSGAISVAQDSRGQCANLIDDEPNEGSLAPFSPKGAPWDQFEQFVTRSVNDALCAQATAGVGRVEVWRGDVRLSMSVFRPFRLAV